MVNFTDIQLYIYDKCPHDELTIIMRRYMMRIAEAFCPKGQMPWTDHRREHRTGGKPDDAESCCTNEVCTLPVFRPVIGFDKQEIVWDFRKIDTYETSISRMKTAVRSLLQNIR